MNFTDRKDMPSIPLPAMVAAVWGGFLHEGMFCSGADERWRQRVLGTWNQGCIELVIDTCIHLPEVWRQICTKWEESDADFSGVFEYEVIAPLGRYFADYLLENNGRLPEATAVSATIRELIADFFQSGVEGNKPTLPSVMSPLAQAVTRNSLRAIRRGLLQETETSPPGPDQVYQELVQLGVEAVFPQAVSVVESGTPEV